MDDETKTGDNNEQLAQAERKTKQHEKSLAKIVHPDIIKANQLIYKDLKAKRIDLVEAQRRSEELLIQASSIDYMTGLDNARAAEIKLADLIEYCSKNGLDLIGIYFDADGLKDLNTQSHDLGDKAIRTVAHALKTGSRSTDLPVRISAEREYSDEDLATPVARVGGDEFFLALPGASLEEARMIFNRVQTIYQETAAQIIPQYPRAAQGKMSLTGGAVQLTPGADENAESFKSRAERAMQFGKENNKGEFIISAMKLGNQP